MINKACVFITILFALAGCNTNKDQLYIKIDLSSERDEGRLTPESGDKVYIVGNFNDWEPGVTILEDPDWDWVFETALDLKDVGNPDTLVFKFVVVSEQNRDLPNSGWEIIPNRVVPIEAILQEEPMFIFNKSWSPLVEKDLTFSVSMSNQVVLGFFDPEKDNVQVSGSFMEWNSEGVLMTDTDGDLVYEIEIPVSVPKDEPVFYRYRIKKSDTEQDSYIPNNGWEISGERTYTNDIGLNYFNNQRRVLKVTAGYDWVAKHTKLTKADELYFVLHYSGGESRNYKMERTHSGVFETAIQVPETLAGLSASVNKNLEEDIYSQKELVVSVKGSEIQLK